MTHAVSPAKRKMMKIQFRRFSRAGRRLIKLQKWPTNVEPVYRSQEHYKNLLGERVVQLNSLQELLYASNRYAVLLLFQAMDTAGKNGVIKHVMSGINPQGCQLYSFKHPSPAELQHAFLWRTTRDLPERGRIGIFNRSYYEEVLIVRVRREILRSEGLPSGPRDDKKVWRDRYRSIVDLERHLYGNGTRINHHILPSPLKGGAAKAFASASRRAGELSEIQWCGPRREEVLEAVHECV
jgi:polyphosphate kinase 2 (PPK2 family)